MVAGAGRTRRLLWVACLWRALLSSCRVHLGGVLVISADALDDLEGVLRMSFTLLTAYETRHEAAPLALKACLPPTCDALFDRLWEHGRLVELVVPRLLHPQVRSTLTLLSGSDTHPALRLPKTAVLPYRRMQAWLLGRYMIDVACPLDDDARGSDTFAARCAAYFDRGRKARDAFCTGCRRELEHAHIVLAPLRRLVLQYLCAL